MKSYDEWLSDTITYPLEELSEELETLQHEIKSRLNNDKRTVLLEDNGIYVGCYSPIYVRRIFNERFKGGSRRYKLI